MPHPLPPVSRQGGLQNLWTGPFQLLVGLFWLNMIMPKLGQWTGFDRLLSPNMQLALSFLHGGLLLALASAIIAMAIRAWLRKAT